MVDPWSLDGPHDETVDVLGAFPPLSDGQILRLLDRGEWRRTAVGDVLYREGDLDYDFVVVLQGKVAVVEDHGGPDERVIARHGPRRFLGEIGLLSGQATFVSAVVLDAGEVVVVPVQRLRKLVLEDVTLGDLILRAYLQRRSILIEAGAGFHILGSCFSEDTRRLREFAARNRLPHRFVDLDKDRGAETLLCQLGIAPEETPVVIWHDRVVLRNPSTAELARVVGLPAAQPRSEVHDLLIVGGGPAGLAAAVYGASEGLSTLLVDGVAAGGQAGSSARIENYLGFPAGLSGADLAERAVLQAQKFGAELAIPAEAVALRDEDGYLAVELDDGSTATARSVVIAAGVTYRRLPVPEFARFEATSVYYAATLVEAHVCAGEPVVVVGGGNSAGQAAIFLSGRASKVRIVAREPDLRASMSRYLIDRLERMPNVEVLLCHEVRHLDGGSGLERIEVQHRRTGRSIWIDTRALFVFIGAEPRTGWLDDQLGVDESGFVLGGPDAVASTRSPDGSHRRPLLFETTRAGVFAVGDIRSASVKRVASAVGEGSMVVRMVHEYLEILEGTDDLRAEPISRPSTMATSSPA